MFLFNFIKLLLINVDLITKTLTMSLNILVKYVHMSLCQMCGGVSSLIARGFFFEKFLFPLLRDVYSVALGIMGAKRVPEEFSVGDDCSNGTFDFDDGIKVT